MRSPGTYVERLHPEPSKVTEDSTLVRARKDPWTIRLRPLQGQGAHHQVPRRPPKLKNDLTGPILSVPPSARPGVGKNLTRPIHCVLIGCKFVRIVLGVYEAEIRHRLRTSAPCPSLTIRALRDAEAKNPALPDPRTRTGATSAATLRARCSRCSTPSTLLFRDHYLDLPFAPSAGSICTANQLGDDRPMAAALLHGCYPASVTPRQEARNRQGVSFSKQLKAHGLKRKELTFTEKLRVIICERMRGGRVRELERQIAGVCEGCGAGSRGWHGASRADQKVVRDWSANAPGSLPDVRKRTSEPGVVPGSPATRGSAETVPFIEHGATGPRVP